MLHPKTTTMMLCRFKMQILHSVCSTFSSYDLLTSFFSPFVSFTLFQGMCGDALISENDWAGYVSVLISVFEWMLLISDPSLRYLNQYDFAIGYYKWMFELCHVCTVRFSTPEFLPHMQERLHLLIHWRYYVTAFLILLFNRGGTII